MSNNLKKSKFYILFIDDEEQSVKYFQKLFGLYFNVISTTNPNEVLKIIDSRSKEIAVVVSDQKMPNASGVDLLAKIKEKNSNIIRILTTAYASLESNIEAINKSNIFAYLSKPWNIKEAQAIFYKAFEEFESRQNYLGLSGSIAHEMRNPLSNVRQSTKIVKEKLTTAHLNEKICGTGEEKITPLTKKDFQEILASLELADNSINRGNTIIDLILNNIGGKVLDSSEFRELKSSTVINKVITEYIFKDQEQGRVIADLQPEQDFILRADETTLIYVFFNLIKNSLYYLLSYPNLKITIRTEIGDDKFNRIYIRDNGPGIPKNKISSIFGAFATFDKKEGTGLGLTFCKRSMISFGGNITCNSEEGKFTEFVLEFPKTIRSENIISSDEAMNKILLVDDQDFNIVIVKSLLEKNLHSVFCDRAGNSLEAIEIAKNNKYDVILMDIEMPEMNGFDAAKEIRKFDQNVPIIAYSSKSFESVADDLKKSGFSEYVAKSSSHRFIIKMVSKWGVIKIAESKVKKTVIGHSLKDKRILLADDEESNLMITTKYFSVHQAKIDKARDGIEVIEMARKNNYDLILMDIQMPKVDGITAIEQIKKLQENREIKNIPIIAVTGDSTKSQIYKILKAGFDDYFIKGNDYDDLLDMVAFYSSLKSENFSLSLQHYQMAAVASKS